MASCNKTFQKLIFVLTELDFGLWSSLVLHSVCQVWLSSGPPFVTAHDWKPCLYTRRGNLTSITSLVYLVYSTKLFIRFIIIKIVDVLSCRERPSEVQILEVSQRIDGSKFLLCFRLLLWQFINIIWTCMSLFANNNDSSSSSSNNNNSNNTTTTTTITKTSRSWDGRPFESYF